MKKENIINRPPGLTFFCIMLLLGSIGGSLGLPVLFLGFGGPLIFLPFIEGLFIFNFYLVYNIWNLRKKSWVLIKIWLLTIFFFVFFYLGRASYLAFPGKRNPQIYLGRIPEGIL